MSMDLRIVVVGHSLRDDSRPVVKAGIEIARALGGRTELVHSYTPLRHQLRVGGAASDLPSWRELHDRLVDELHRQSESMGVDEQNVVGWHVEAGSPHEVLNNVAESLDADLIVVGPAESGALRRGALGSTVNRLLHSAHRPIWVAREGGRIPPRRILAAVDFSTHSLEALHVAEQLLDVMRAVHEGSDLERFEVVTVLDPSEAQQPLTPQQLEEFVGKELAEMLEEHTGLSSAEVDLRVLRGDPRDVLVEEIRRGDFDLAVLGAHGRAGSDRFGLIGRVAYDLARRAPCSVLIVPVAAMWIAAASTLPRRRGRARP